jgi:transcriptional regulator with XRE-family HTH domain
MKGMNEQSKSDTPFKTLGVHLKYLREQSNESLAEVSGAVEIDEGVLERIEAGMERPAEDILLLLITHFNMQDQEAVQLWELAGYDGTPETAAVGTEDVEATAQKAVVMFLALDSRIIYTDGIETETNKGGVTLNFTQAGGQKQPTVVSRVGMSFEQAEEVLQTLQQALLRARYLKGPKALPPAISPPTDDTSPDV